ncbi:N-acetylmuramoyl-L-alanine amidase [bacterium]|nr:N-acetylmuramoyl-L-alanine amidase [bacterium]
MSGLFCPKLPCLYQKIEPEFSKRGDQMKINNHLLEGEGVKQLSSPNRGGQFGAGLPDTIIIHYTGGSSAESSAQWLCDPRAKASAHLVVGCDGVVYQLVPFNTVAWHAGKSEYKGRVGFNNYSIGIEIDNAGRLTKGGGGYISTFGKVYGEDQVTEAVHRNESAPSYWHIYSEKQIAAVESLCLELMGAYNISAILGHEEVAPGRKSDPGPAFPLDKLRDRIINPERALAEALPRKSVGVVTASLLNIRSRGFPGAPTVAPPLSKGVKVDILQEQNGWYEVDVQMRGWVKKDFIRS